MTVHTTWKTKEHNTLGCQNPPNSNPSSQNLGLLLYFAAWSGSSALSGSSSRTRPTKKIFLFCFLSHTLIIRFFWGSQSLTVWVTITLVWKGNLWIYLPREVVESASLEIFNSIRTQFWVTSLGQHSCLKREFEVDDLQWSLQTLTILWFCVIKNHREIGDEIRVG